MPIPEKSKKERAKHLAANDPTGQCSTCQVKSNVKSRPGVMTVRGCAYAGAKGVVWGPVKDQITVSHGPVGCGQYSWWSRRNYYNGQTGIDAFGTMHITTDFQEKNIVYGGDKGLDAALKELKGLFPLGRGIGILSECPVGLIGDDIEAVSKRVAKEWASRSFRSVRGLSRSFPVPRAPYCERYDQGLCARQRRTQEVHAL